MLTRRLVDGLKNVPGASFAGGPGVCGCDVGYGIVSFRMNGIPARDVGFALDHRDIWVRTGDHCIGVPDGVEDSVRVSMHAYNTEEEIDRLVAALGAL
jgi:cysteine desulfurase/selenocysteine lyase